MRRIAGLAMAFIMGAGAAQAAATCAPAGSEKAVAAAAQAWFEAGRRDDLSALDVIQAPGFYAYDNGNRYDGLALGQLVKAAHGSGTQIEWNLHDFDIHLGCDQAWAAWVNTGAVGTRGAMQPVTWLESAVFAWRDGAWKMAFLHSGRVAQDAATPASSSESRAKHAHR